MTNQLTGNQGEELACKFLQNNGYKVLERNFRIRGGEIDIIAKDGEEIVFVEVKARYSHEYGLPSESITYFKLKALQKAALFYLQKKGWLEKGYRFDFVGIDFVPQGDYPLSGGAHSKENPEIELLKNITG